MRAAVAAASLSLCTVLCHADLPTRFTPEQRRLARLYMAAVRHDLPRLKKIALKVPAAREEVRLAEALLDPRTTSNEGARQVLAFYRHRLAQASPRQYLYPGSPSGYSLDNYAMLLYLTKGSVRGFHEFTRLTGCPSGTMSMLWEKGRRWDSDELLDYRLSLVLMSLDAHRKFNVLHGERSYDDLTPIFEQILKEMGNKPQLRRVVLNYAFEPASHIAVVLWDRKTWADTDPHRMLAEYYSKLIPLREDKIEFLNRVQQRFGKGALAPLLKRVVGAPGFGKDVVFVTAMYELSRKAGLSAIQEELGRRYPRVRAQVLSNAQARGEDTGTEFFMGSPENSAAE